MTDPAATAWDGAAVRTWLDRRIAAARLDQAVAQRGGRAEEDDCDKASAEELVCTILRGGSASEAQATFAEALRGLLARDDYPSRGVYDDVRFERHVRGYIRKVAKMAKTNQGFDRIGRYQ